MDLIVVYVLPGKQEPTRIGFSVGGKLGGAVARNRTRRVLQEAARRLTPGVKPGYCVVVVARTKAAQASFWEISAAMHAAFAKSGILNAGN